MGTRIALVTGATGGIGHEFVKQLLDELFGLDELWALARNEENLQHLRDEFGPRVVPVSIDLADSNAVCALAARLERERPTVAMLVNNAGIARMGASGDFPLEEIETTVALNCTAMAQLCTVCLPFMEPGSCILNSSSASAFQPVPYLNLYAATKAFERSYSRALAAEVRGLGITVCAICPSWVDTDLLQREVNGRRVAFPGLVSPERVVTQALRAARKGRDQSVCPLYAKYLHVCSKLLPHRLVMAAWTRMLARYERV